VILRAAANAQSGANGAVQHDRRNSDRARQRRAGSTPARPKRLVGERFPIGDALLLMSHRFTGADRVPEQRRRVAVASAKSRQGTEAAFVGIELGATEATRVRAATRTRIG